MVEHDSKDEKVVVSGQSHTSGLMGRSTSFSFLLDPAFLQDIEELEQR